MRKKKYDDQPTLFESLNLASDKKSDKYVQDTRKEPHKNLSLRRAVIAWLLESKPNGIGINVPTRFTKFLADVAAFWSKPVKGKFLVPYRTVVVEIRHNREDCWPDCSAREQILLSLKNKKEEKRRIEAQIRKTEPELKDTDNLFNEYESWNYSATKNKSYQKCLKEIEKLEHSLYKGSYFEQIRRTHVATALFLAVPADAVHADELANGWGLIYVSHDKKVKVVKEAEERECSEQSKMHLVQNIASSNLKSLLMTNGIRQLPSGKTIFTRVPKQPHRPEKTK